MRDAATHWSASISSDRAYFRKARQTRDLVFSDFLLAKYDHDSRS